MCGICGIIDLQQKNAPTWRTAQVEKMNAKILHRGPDEGAMRTFDQATLAMRRLSIIDLHTGSQPIYNETGDICVFFNGEIYNY
ncbi:MAG: asparagine synthase (glutamine-hydrolyzing), partial [Phaeodactylibacter sp.]|nr:asparagine synthase (glutamine-hydrolyzing) [Phaeodactylibacter sp.]